jgi:hypothetical protein
MGLPAPLNPQEVPLYSARLHRFLPLPLANHLHLATQRRHRLYSELGQLVPLLQSQYSASHPINQPSASQASHKLGVPTPPRLLVNLRNRRRHSDRLHNPPPLSDLHLGPLAQQSQVNRHLDRLVHLEVGVLPRLQASHLYLVKARLLFPVLQRLLLGRRSLVNLPFQMLRPRHQHSEQQRKEHPCLVSLPHLVKRKRPYLPSPPTLLDRRLVPEEVVLRLLRRLVLYLEPVATVQLLPRGMHSMVVEVAQLQHSLVIIKRRLHLALNHRILRHLFLLLSNQRLRSVLSSHRRDLTPSNQHLYLVLRSPNLNLYLRSHHHLLHNSSLQQHLAPNRRHYTNPRSTTNFYQKIIWTCCRRWL